MEIILYTMDHCSMCELAKKYLEDLELDFEIRNVSANKDYRNELLQRGHIGVPIIEIDGEDIVGLDKDKLNDVLKKEAFDDLEKDEE